MLTGHLLIYISDSMITDCYINYSNIGAIGNGTTSKDRVIQCLPVASVVGSVTLQGR